MKPTQSDTVFLPTKNAAFRRIEDEVVIVDTERSRMLTLNETGSEIWTLLDGKSIHEIAVSISEIFNIDYKQALDDATNFLSDLHVRGLVEHANESV